MIDLTPEGALDMDSFSRLLTPRTRLLAITHVSNVLGTINPVHAMIDQARATADVAEQNDIYKTLQRKLVDDQVGVFVLTQRSQQAMHNCLQNFTWVPMQSFEFNFHTMKWVCD